MKEADYIVKVKNFLKLSKKEVKKYKRLSAKYYGKDEQKWGLAWILSHSNVVFDETEGKVMVGYPYFYQLNDEEEEIRISYVSGESFRNALETAISKVSFKVVHDYAYSVDGDGSSWYEYYRMKV